MIPEESSVLRSVNRVVICGVVTRMMTKPKIAFYWCASCGGCEEAVVDLGAITANVAALCELVRGSQVLAAVKADGYGHGMVPAARAALAGGAAWLGVADLDEAVALRRAGLTAPVLCMMTFGDPAEAVRHDIDLAAGSAGYVAAVEAAAVQAGVQARLHLKADTGLSRGGATPADWPAVVTAALAAQARGSVRVTGLWSHFACADVPGHPSITVQLAGFADAVAVAEKAGVTPEVRHIANTAAALTVPESRYDLVRFGGAVYGLSTLPGGAPSWLRPVMTLRARLAMVKRVPAGTGVSYGHRYVTARETTLGLVPLGYADGVPRGAAGLPLVSARGRRWPIAGTVCMDQFVVDLDGDEAAPGDRVVLFGENSVAFSVAYFAIHAAGGIAVPIGSDVSVGLTGIYRRVGNVFDELRGLDRLGERFDTIARLVQRLTVGDLTPYGLPPSPRGTYTRAREGQIPILDVGLIDALKSRRVTVVSAVRAFDQTGNIRDRGASITWKFNDADDRVKRRKRIGGDLRPRRRNFP